MWYYIYPYTEIKKKVPQMCNKRLCNQHIHESQTLNKTRKRNVQHTCLKMLLIKTTNNFASNCSLRRCLYILNYMHCLYPARHIYERKIVTLSFTLEIYVSSGPTIVALIMLSIKCVWLYWKMGLWVIYYVQKFSKALYISLFCRLFFCVLLTQIVFLGLAFVI